MDDHRPPAWSLSERKLLEEAIVPSPHSVELERTAMGDFLHRLAAPAPHVAELFHENSKLTEASTLTVPADRRKLDEVRAWYFTTAYAMDAGEIEPREEHRFRISLDDLPPALAGRIAPFTAPGPVTDLLYAVDLLVLHDRRLARLVAGTPKLWIERTLTGEEAARLKAAIRGIGPARLARLASFVVLVGCPWRYMLMYGPRGYRHTLFDAGRVLARLEGAGEGAPPTVIQDFYDARLDRLIYADGVERSTLALVGLEDPGAGGGER